MTPLDNESRVLKLIERQATHGELRRRLREEGTRELLKAYPHLPEGPWITISRSAGSRGSQIARQVAERLGWVAYDREIVETIARKADVRQKVIDTLDERVIGDLDDYFSRLAVKDYPGASVFIRHLMAVVTTLGRRGKAVLVGRGAQFLLHPEYGLRVRVVAPLELRARRHARMHRIPVKEARRQVGRIDAQRIAWIRRYFREELTDPLSHDLVINTAHLTLEQAVDLVVLAFRSRFETTAP